MANSFVAAQGSISHFHAFGLQVAMLIKVS
jgi:hypothetical protein